MFYVLEDLVIGLLDLHPSTSIIYRVNHAKKYGIAYRHRGR